MDLEINAENIHQIPTKEHLQSFPIIEHPSEINYNTFFENYLLKNQACLIKNVANNWEATEKWTERGKRINFDYLKATYGDCEVLAYDCNEKYFNSHKTSSQSLNNYLTYWQKHNAKDAIESQKLLYLKDWHLKNAFPQDEFYKVPLFFASDWLNEYLIDTNKDDYRFVYMGPKKTWTPLHADVFKSYSWSVNIIGKKEWILFPAGEEAKFGDNLTRLPHELKELGDVKHFRLIQNAGDAIFIPSGWYHQVKNVTDTISVNHNWINGCNLHYVYEDMLKHLQDVRNEIADCCDDEDFADQCQLVLKASFGMNLQDFFKFVQHIAKKRMISIDIASNLNLFDLVRIQSVLHSMVVDKSVENVQLLSDIHCLIKELHDFLLKIS